MTTLIKICLVFICLFLSSISVGRKEYGIGVWFFGSFIIAFTLLMFEVINGLEI